MKKVCCITTLLVMTGLFSCQVERLQVPSEPFKKINGTWQIIDATLNGTDLTHAFDFSKFRITFTDSTYTIDSLLPFMVKTDGKWAFNDPKYPFSLTLTATDSAAVTAPLVFPVVAGVRNMIITFSPGCKLNSYQYTLQQVNN
jgi:hypothetical protein